MSYAAILLSGRLEAAKLREDGGSFLSDKDRKFLLKAARDNIASWLKKRRGIRFFPTDVPPALLEKRGVFVTLKKRGELRGCIGYLTGMKPLVHAVLDNSYNAAFKDPRFGPVTAGELPAITIEISVLTEPVRGEVRGGDTGRQGRPHMERGPYRGLLLPQVAVEQGWDRNTFLDQTCLKAGLRARRVEGRRNEDVAVPGRSSSARSGNEIAVPDDLMDAARVPGAGRAGALPAGPGGPGAARLLRHLLPALAMTFYVKPAKMWKKLEGGAVQVHALPQRLSSSMTDERGICRVRQNIRGSLYTLVYSRIAAAHVDPIEKKPLFHFLPGSTAFSVATAGCNLSCQFCQNWQLSQADPTDLDAERIDPEELSPQARRSGGSKVIAFTYNEPTVQFEYILDSRPRLPARSGVRSIIISNGYIMPGRRHGCSRRTSTASRSTSRPSPRISTARSAAGRLKPVLDNLVSLHGHSGNGSSSWCW